MWGRIGCVRRLGLRAIMKGKAKTENKWTKFGWVLSPRGEDPESPLRRDCPFFFDEVRFSEPLPPLFKDPEMEDSGYSTRRETPPSYPLAPVPI
jgi:hypothetical protein